LDELRRRLPAWLAFTSPSAFDNLMWLLEVREPERYLAGSRLCAIGSTTAEHLRRVVGRADVVSEERSLAGLARAIVEDAAERTRERKQ
jgi:uroporphyrinogen-III synthase